MKTIRKIELLPAMQKILAEKCVEYDENDKKALK